MNQKKSDLAIRSSCKDCGTPLFMTYYAMPDSIGVAAGTVNEASIHGELLKPQNHIFVSDKAKWYTIPDDGLERYDTFPPEFEDTLETWKQQTKRRQ